MSRFSDLLFILKAKTNKPNKKSKTDNKYPVSDCKEIVVWGSNLGLTNAKPLFTPTLRKMVELPILQFSALLCYSVRAPEAQP